MKSKFKHIALVGKYQMSTPPGVQPIFRNILENIAQFLYALGCEVFIEEATASSNGLSGHPVLNLEDIGSNCDLALVVGGDGTMLGFGRRLAPHDVPLIGINQGRLGFITDLVLSQMHTTLPPMLQGEYVEDKRSLLHAQVWRGGHCVFDTVAMNDVVLNRGPSSGMVEIRVEVDGHFVANQRADGLIIATPTGSTAYALSAGGPLLHPLLEGLAMVPIAPHTLSNRPLVLADPGEIVMELVSGREASVNFDMQSLTSVMIGDRVSIKRSPHSVRFLHPRGWTYFDNLREKLHWNEGAP